MKFIGEVCSFLAEEGEHYWPAIWRSACSIRRLTM